MQIQDIAGCRVVVLDIQEQDRVVAALCTLFPAASVMDRRANPSYGYRAVHVIAQVSGKLVEIQIRTSLQHLWAEFSEKLSDTLDPEIKYGGGPDYIKSTLTNTSSLVLRAEEGDSLLANWVTDSPETEATRQRLRQDRIAIKKDIADFLSETIAELERLTAIKR